MMKIQVVSDLHLEFWATKQVFRFFKPTAPILAMVGDICCCGAEDDFAIFQRFIEEILPHYEMIIHVSGNHEYYFNPSKKSDVPTPASTILGIDAKITAYFNARNKKLGTNKLFYLNNKSIKLTEKGKPIVILGSTLWSWIPVEQRGFVGRSMNDYQFIYETPEQKITSTYVANKHLASVKWLNKNINKALSEDGCKVIVLTHHKPYLSPNYDPTKLDVAYESDLVKLMKPGVVLWAYGHTHIKDRSLIGKTLLYSNPKGYPNQKTKFEAGDCVVLK